MNYVLALILLSTGASRSFVSVSFSKNFSISFRMRDLPILVEIENDKLVREDKVSRSYTIEIYDERFLIDHVLLLMGEINGIVDMECLDQNYV